MHAVQPFFFIVWLTWQIINIYGFFTRAYSTTVALTTPAVGLPILTGMAFRRDNLGIHGLMFVWLAQVGWLAAFMLWVLSLVLKTDCIKVLLIWDNTLLLWIRVPGFVHVHLLIRGIEISACWVVFLDYRFLLLFWVVTYFSRRLRYRQWQHDWRGICIFALLETAIMGRMIHGKRAWWWIDAPVFIIDSLNKQLNAFSLIARPFYHY